MQLSAKGVKMLELDLVDEMTINQAAKDFGNQPLDILINVAGTSGCHRLRVRHKHIQLMQQGLYYLWDEKPFSEQAPDDLLDHFKVNVVVLASFARFASSSICSFLRALLWSRRPFCLRCHFPLRLKLSTFRPTSQV